MFARRNIPESSCKKTTTTTHRYCRFGDRDSPVFDVSGQQTFHEVKVQNNLNHFKIFTQYWPWPLWQPFPVLLREGRSTWPLAQDCSWFPPQCWEPALWAWPSRLRPSRWPCAPARGTEDVHKERKLKEHDTELGNIWHNICDFWDGFVAE